VSNGHAATSWGASGAVIRATSTAGCCLSVRLVAAERDELGQSEDTVWRQQRDGAGQRVRCHYGWRCIMLRYGQALSDGGMATIGQTDDEVELVATNGPAGSDNSDPLAVQRVVGMDNNDQSGSWLVPPGSVLLGLPAGRIRCSKR
jgi:hypothetical protein